MLRIALLFCLAGMISCSEVPQPRPSAHRLIYNNDGTETLGNNWFGKRPLTMDDLNGYVDMVANSQVTTYMICSGSDFFYYRSKYGRLMGDDKDGQLDCGKDTALYNVLRRINNNALRIEKEGTDIVEATLKRVKEKKLEAFVTYRMNDLHFADTSTGCTIQYADFWYDNPSFWTNDTSLPGWNAKGALDFAHPEVREFKLNIIREQLEKYGALIDGYELDFMRFIVYFKKAEAEKNAPLITELVKAAKHITDSVAKAHGKKILLTARVPANLPDCNSKGLDVREWVKLGLVDFLTMGVHWRGDPAMGVAQFKQDIGSDIPVYVTMDDGGLDPREVWSHGMYRGMASHAMAQGAAGMYLFNYFLTAYNEAGQQLKPEEGTMVCRTIAPELLRELGSLETLRKRNKVYCLSDGVTSYNLHMNSPLPLKVVGKDSASIYVGDDVTIDKPEELVLFVRSKGAAKPAISFNGFQLSIADSSYPKLYDKLRGLKTDQHVQAYLVPAEQVKQGYNNVSFSVNQEQSVLVQRLELAVKYGAVEEFGYF